MERLSLHQYSFFNPYSLISDLSYLINAALKLDKHKRTSQSQPSNSSRQTPAAQLPHKYPLYDPASDSNPLTNNDAKILAE